MVTSPEQFTLSLRQLGISQAQLARHFGLFAVTVSRWAHGHTPIPGPARRWLELALAVKRAAHIPAKRGNLRMIKPRHAAALALVGWYLQ